MLHLTGELNPTLGGLPDHAGDQHGGRPAAAHDPVLARPGLPAVAHSRSSATAAASTPTVCAARPTRSSRSSTSRTRTTPAKCATPLPCHPQAFTLLNSDLMTDRSIAFALRLERRQDDATEANRRAPSSSPSDGTVRGRKLERMSALRAARCSSISGACNRAAGRLPDARSPGRWSRSSPAGRSSTRRSCRRSKTTSPTRRRPTSLRDPRARRCLPAALQHATNSYATDRQLEATPSRVVTMIPSATNSSRTSSRSSRLRRRHGASHESLLSSGLGATLGLRRRFRPTHARAHDDCSPQRAGSFWHRRQPMLPAEAPRPCIMLFMEGGPGHMDTFDPKPKLTELHKTESKLTARSRDRLQVLRRQSRSVSARSARPASRCATSGSTWPTPKWPTNCATTAAARPNRSTIPRPCST